MAASEASTPAPQGMNVTPVLDTANFREVLRHFNEDGSLKNEYTRISIECCICKIALIGPFNPRYDPSADMPHELYLVLPRCGHAFGYKCLFHWMITRDTTFLTLALKRRCPLCVNIIFSPRFDTPPLEIYGRSTDENIQREEIRKIREQLEDLEDPTHELVQG